MSTCPDSLPVWEFAESAVELQLITLQDSNEFREEMKLKESLKSQDFSEIKMKQITFGSKRRMNADKTAIPADRVIRQNSGKHGSIIFVIRRPGCVFCREEALTLRILSQKYPYLLEGFNIFGIVKEIDVDNNGLAEFHRNYFPFPIFLDESLSFYNAFGRRRVSFKKVLALAVPAMKRIKRKKIKGNFRGQGFIQGGTIICDNDAQPRFMYEEETGTDFPIGFLLKALTTIRDADRTS